MNTFAVPTIPAPRIALQPARTPHLRDYRKIIWIILLAVGYWFATPYYFPWSAADEANADTRAIAAAGSIERQLAMPCLMVLALYMLWKSRPLPQLRGYIFNAAVVYMVFSAASIAWSTDPSVSVRRFVVLAMDVFLMVTLARVYSIMELARVGFFVNGFAALFAFCIDALVTRTFAPLDPDYRLMGIMSSNYMGENLTVCIFCGLTLMMYSTSKKHTRWYLLSIFAAFILLYLTRSRTATISCLLFSSFLIKRLIDARFPRSSRVTATLVVAGLVLGFFVAQGNVSETAQKGFMMGRKDTENTASLSNRLPLWKEVVENIDKHPLLGYGYRAFWTPERIAIFSDHQKWPVPNAHNTYLDEYIDSGILGAPLFAFVFWCSLLIAWRRYIKVPSPEHLLPAVMLSWLFFTSWVESVPPDPFLPTTLAYACMIKSMLPSESKRRAKAESPQLPRAQRTQTGSVLASSSAR